MEILRTTADGSFESTGRICDRCRLIVRLPGSELGALLRYQEFVTVSFLAGYGAEHFNDGDYYRCDLCERCACELLGPYLHCSPARPEFRDEHLG